MTYEFVLLSGIPGSGKSTWAEIKAKEIEDRHETVAIISRDNIRFSMLKDGEDYFSHENDVFNEYVRQLNEAMELGINYVIADATHLTEGSINKLLRRLIPDSRTSLEIVFFDCPLDIALERNSKREGLKRVPEKEIVRMKKSFHPERIVIDSYEFSGISYSLIK